jgi:cytochrome bd-type quinol oxidase subunit 2
MIPDNHFSRSANSLLCRASREPRVLCGAAHIRNWDASPLPDSQLFLLMGMMFLIPTILAYAAFSY